MSSTPTDRLYRIVQDGMCIGCGLCQSVAGEHSIRIARVESGYQRPVVVGELSHETVDRIYDLCPGTRLEGLPASEIDTDTCIDRVWGPYRRMLRAHASDPDTRFKAATGGVLTALGQYLVQSGEVALVLHASASERYPTFGEYQISRDAEQVLAGSGSRYGPTSVLIDVHSLLDRGEPFAFVGKPCDIAALRNLARHDERVDVLVKYWLTPVCGGFLPPAFMHRFLAEREGVDPERVTTFRYRGNGCPGQVRYTTRDGVDKVLRYTDLWGTDESQWSLPFRCKVCPDGIGEAADIVAADSWPGGSPDPRTEDRDPGTNAVIVRTRQGDELIRRAQDAGFLSIEAACDPRYMDDIQPHQVNKKRTVLARWEGLRSEGCTVPRTARLRLDALMQELGEAMAQVQREGARKRIRARRHAEARPRLPDES